MLVTAVMAALATELDKISTLRVYDYPSNAVVPPAAIVGFPETITFDMSAGRGQDHLEIPVIVLAGKVSDRTALDVLGPFLDGTGSASVKAVLEAQNRSYTAFSRVRVRSVTVEVITIGGVEYLAGIFSLDVYGTGD